MHSIIRHITRPLYYKEISYFIKRAAPQTKKILSDIRSPIPKPSFAHLFRFCRAPRREERGFAAREERFFIAANTDGWERRLPSYREGKGGRREEDLCERCFRRPANYNFKFANSTRLPLVPNRYVNPPFALSLVPISTASQFQCKLRLSLRILEVNSWNLMHKFV